MKIIDRKDPPKPWWLGPWRCTTCGSILEPEQEHEIRREDAQYNDTDYFVVCPVCEEQRRVVRHGK